MKKANKSEITRVIGDRLGANYRDSERITNVLFDVLREILSEGRTIEVRNFGTFRVKNLERRTARNPKTGESVIAQARKQVLFKAGKRLREI